MKQRRPLREGTSSRPLPLGFVLPPVVEEAAPAAVPTRGYYRQAVYVVQAVRPFNVQFASHPAGGVPGRVFQRREDAEAACAELNRAFRAVHCPLEQPPRGGVCQLDEEGYLLTWTEDEQRLHILGDYVQDLGLTAPELGTTPAYDWQHWWRKTAATLEPWQREAIWTFLDREPRYRVSEVEYCA